MNTRFKWLFLILLFAAPAFAQNVRVDNVTFSSVQGFPFLPGATITICTAAATGLPCSPTVVGTCLSISDATCNQSATITSDAFGNYGFWIQPGSYTYTVTKAGFGGFGPRALTLACQPTASCTMTAAQTINSNLTVSGTLNGIPMVNAANFANVQAALNSLGSTPGIVFVPPGTWAPAAANAPLTLTNSFQRIVCAGMDSTVIQYSGTTNITAVVDVGTADNGTAQQVNDAVTNCTISGNSHTTYALRVRGTHRSDFSHNKLINAVTAGLFSDFAVADTFDDLHTSSQEQAFSTVPASCFIFDGPDASHQTTATTIKNPICEGVSGTGIQLNHSVQVTLLGGTSEQNNIGIVLSSNAVKDTVAYLDTESNAVANIQDGGFQCTFHDDSGNGLLEVLGTANFTLISGYFYDSIKVDTSAQNTQLDHVGYNNSGSGTFTDNGSGTLKLALQNLSGAAYTPGTFPAFNIFAAGNVLNITTAGTAVNTLTTQTVGTITVGGAVLGMACVANVNGALPATWQTGIQYECDVTSSGTVTVYLKNPTAGSITPAATQINVKVVQ